MQLNSDEVLAHRLAALDGCPRAMTTLACHFGFQNYLGDAAYFLAEAYAVGGSVTEDTREIARRCGTRLAPVARAHYAVPALARNASFL